MPKGYWIATVDVQNPEVYEKYRQANAKAFADFGGRFLARGGTQQAREGNWKARTVVIEFPSYADAVACYQSPSYQGAKDIRLSAAESDLLILEGYDGE